MSETRLIVNADDFGMSRGITDAIILSHRYGFLTSTSLMVNTPASEYAASRARQVPELAVGVHLNVCQGKPLLPAHEVQTLVRSDGSFHPPREMARRLWMRRAASADLEREFRAQIGWMKNHGLVPFHADSHHHMHLYPAAAGAFARALKAEGIACSRASICTEFPRLDAIGSPYKGGFLRRTLVEVYRQILQRTAFRRLDSPDSRVVIPSRNATGPSSLCERWKRVLDNLPSGTFELACHPGLFERGFSETDPIQAQREEELFCLTDRDLRDLIQRRGIRLITYRDLFPKEKTRIASEAAA